MAWGAEARRRPPWTASRASRRWGRRPAPRLRWGGNGPKMSMSSKFCDILCRKNISRSSQEQVVYIFFHYDPKRFPLSVGRTVQPRRDQRRLAAEEVAFPSLRAVGNGNGESPAGPRAGLEPRRTWQLVNAEIISSWVRKKKKTSDVAILGVPEDDV